MKWLVMICYIDLPKLTSILNVSSGSFQNIHMLILQSSFESWLLWRLDIPNLKNVKLSGSFQYVQSKSISSIVWMCYFIYRCVYHSYELYPNQKILIPTMDLHVLLNTMMIAYSVLLMMLVPNLFYHSLFID